MFRRKVPCLTACLLAAVAVLASPLSSRADTQILIQQGTLDSMGNFTPIGTAQIFGNQTNVTLNSPTGLSNFSHLNISANSSSGAVSSLTTTINGIPVATGFNPAIDLRVIVTTDGFTTPISGGKAVVSNNASASSAISGAQDQFTNNTQVLTVPLSKGTDSSSTPASGTSVGSATGTASDVRPGGGISPTTTSNISGFPSSFAIQQTIDVQAINVSAGGIESGSTLGGSASSLVTTSAVPAPGGLALALIGLPLIGLRRALRKLAVV